MTFKFGGSGGGGGQLTEISAVADGAIANGAPCVQGGDGKVAAPTGNFAANAVDINANTSTNNNSASYTFYNGITVVDRAAGRGIMIGCHNSSYNYRAICKLFTVNTTTGGGTGTGFSSTNFSYTQGSYVNYAQYPVGAIWDSDTDSWFGCYRFNSSASGGLNMFKHRTTNGYTTTAGYGHTLGTSTHWNPYSTAYVGGTSFIEARGFKYLITSGSTQAYGRDSCMVHGPFTWTSNAHNGGAFGAHVLATDYVANGYNYTSDATYDSANEQIVVATANYAAGAFNQTLYAFDVAANGAVTYSHYLANAGGADNGQIRKVECDTSGNIVWSELTSQKFYAASNNGSAFTKGGSLSWPGSVHSQISMRYSPTYKNFVASFVPSSYSSLPPPKHIIFAVGAGNFLDKTFESQGTGSNYGTNSNYAGYQDYPNTAYKIGGNYVDTTDTFIQYNFGNADGNTVSEVNSNKISTSNLYTGNYIGLAKAAISNGASGAITTKGAINESQSGLTAGARYAVTPTGTVKTESSLTEAEQLSSVFLGTATAANAIIVGDSLVAVDSSATHNDVPKSVATSGTSAVAAYSTDSWTGVINRFGIGTTNVSATGTNTILKVTGVGTVLYFIIGNSSGNSSTNIQVLIDGVQILQSGNVTTGNQYPYCPIGEFSGVNSSKHGNASPSTAFTFNKSFEVKNNGGTATSFKIAYKIVEN